MGIEARMEELAKEKGMKTKKQLEKKRLDKLNKEKPTLNYFYNLLNKKILLVFMNNEQVMGTLKSFNPYELCLETSKIPELIIFKHSIKFLHSMEVDTK